ncbi:arginase family protein [Vibrio mexicanus]|uniref:arginase family protein n=1 Tax=Vibrio mexicanus TaxID=1004326 RepID=UPI00063CF3DB|nr:arginase family protein [Vibrio mexicanus]
MDKLSNKRSFDIIGAPFNQLGWVTTSENTVDGLRRSDMDCWNGLTEWIDIRNRRWGADIVDTGDVAVSDSVFFSINADKKDRALVEYATDLKERLLESYKNGRIPITIGGDHAIAVGTLQATMEYYQKQQGKKVAIVWVDAHADCNTLKDSNLHGKPLAIMMNQYHHNGWSMPKDIEVNPKDVYYVAVRDWMLNEYELKNELGMKNYDMPTIDKMGMNKVVEELMEKLEAEYDHIYLSFDYDALDGAMYRACATPYVGGLSAREALQLVDTVSSSEKFVGADFVEYMPERDPTSVSKEVMVKIIDAIWGYRL